MTIGPKKDKNMKNVAKKSTSLKPSCPPKNGLQERLANGVLDGSLDCHKEKSLTPSSDNQMKEHKDQGSYQNLAACDDNSNDSLLEVSCVEVVDAPSAKSPSNDDNDPCSRSSTPVSVTRPTSGHAINGARKPDVVSDDEVIICEQPGSDVDRSSAAKSPCSPGDASNRRHVNGPVCRVDNFEIFENKVDADGDEPASKSVNGGHVDIDDKEVEVIDVDGSAPRNATEAEIGKKRPGLKRTTSDNVFPTDTSQAKKLRLEAAEAEVLTSFVNAQQLTENRETKVSLTSKQLNELIRECIEEYISKSHSSIVKQLKAEVERLKKSRDEWKETADKLRKDVTLVQSAQQRKERRRASVTRVQRRSVGCQAREKVPNATNRSPGKSAAGEAGKTVAPPNCSESVAALAPSILPPASANLSTNQRLKWLHQQGLRANSSGPAGAPSRPAIQPGTNESTTQPGAVLRPQAPSSAPNSAVMIDLTAEEDNRSKQQTALVPSGVLSSIMPPGNMVLAPNNSAYLLYASAARPAAMKPTDVVSIGALPASIAAGDGYHSLPSLVSINSRHPATVLQVVNIRPPPPLQSAPLRTALPILAPANIQRIAVSSPSVLHHPAPLPPTPIGQNAPPDAKQVPPKPTLKLSRVAQGIVLSWNASISPLQEEPSTYQLYAYQQGPEMPSSALWKKVGNVKALALPMACTLTQFQVGNKYHFAVRAVDRHGRIGPFSEPGSIHLEGGSST